MQEVTLLRSETEERLGITLSCSCSSGSDDLDTEVYIAAVEPSSLAGRDGRLQRGDQILQVNGEDITTREAAEHMFNSPGTSITLLVSRYYEEVGEKQEVGTESTDRGQRLIISRYLIVRRMAMTRRWSPASGPPAGSRLSRGRRRAPRSSTPTGTRPVRLVPRLFRGEKDSAT